MEEFDDLFNNTGAISSDEFGPNVGDIIMVEYDGRGEELANWLAKPTDDDIVQSFLNKKPYFCKVIELSQDYPGMTDDLWFNTKSLTTGTNLYFPSRRYTHHDRYSGELKKFKYTKLPKDFKPDSLTENGEMDWITDFVNNNLMDIETGALYYFKPILKDWEFDALLSNMAESPIKEYLGNILKSNRATLGLSYFWTVTDGTWGGWDPSINHKHSFYSGKNRIDGREYFNIGEPKSDRLNENGDMEDWISNVPDEPLGITKVKHIERDKSYTVRVINNGKFIQMCEECFGLKKEDIIPDYDREIAIRTSRLLSLNQSDIYCPKVPTTDNPKIDSVEITFPNVDYSVADMWITDDMLEFQEIDYSQY